MNSCCKNVELKPFAALMACFSGSVLEWYDFSIYGFLAPIMSPYFFPVKNHWLSLIYAYAVFALGYLVRVVGGFVFGRMGDRKGRKSTLIFTVLLMAIPTFLIGLLPGYQQVGVLAPLLLILLRILQGFATGGELIGVTTYLYETSPLKHRASYSAVAFASSGMGILLGSFVVMLSQREFGHHDLAWRVPFLLAALSAVIGPWLRLRLRESAEFIAAQKKIRGMQESMRDLWRKHRINASCVMLYFVPTAVAFYAGFVFMPGFLIKSTHLSKHLIFLINTANTLLVLIIAPISGVVADRVGVSRVLRFSLCLLFVVVIPCFYFMATDHLTRIVLSQSLLAVVIGLVSGPLMAYALSMSKTQYRYTVTATSYNLAYSIFGGTIPLLGSILVHRFHSVVPIGLYIFVLAGLLLVLHFFKPEASY